MLTEPLYNEEIESEVSNICGYSRGIVSTGCRRHFGQRLMSIGDLQGNAETSLVDLWAMLTE
jgi:hypothetical protein